MTSIFQLSSDKFFSIFVFGVGGGGGVLNHRGKILGQTIIWIIENPV